MPFKCGTCQTNIVKGRASIQCKACSLWSHASCVKISDETLTALKGNKLLSFLCPSCDVNASSESSLREEVTTLNSKIDAFIRKGEDERDSVKKALDAMMDLKQEISSCVKELKSDIVNCSKLINHVESSTTVKITQLEIENNMLHRKFNRADFIINGLPNNLIDLSSVIFDLGSFYKIPIVVRDINHVCYINSKRSVLVKLNSVSLRDAIMREYFKTLKSRPLLISDLVPINDVARQDDHMAPTQENQNDITHQNDKRDTLRINKRVFLNDHYPPAAGKLNALCKKLLKDKIIIKFTVVNADKPFAKLTMSDGKVRERDAAECASLLMEKGGPYVVAD